jgi:hypothetical protein
MFYRVQFSNYGFRENWHSEGNKLLKGANEIWYVFSTFVDPGCIALGTACVHKDFI